MKRSDIRIIREINQNDPKLMDVTAAYVVRARCTVSGEVGRFDDDGENEHVQEVEKLYEAVCGAVYRLPMMRLTSLESRLRSLRIGSTFSKEEEDAIFGTIEEMRKDMSL